ncbi:ATP-binding cassette domain-containing protein [Rossellomorea aquimaris]|uniref:Putative ABC transport system ATP-binding protein n=1 Tax=Rossellomorea aquimaris TaxID=189382 RepID=A0A366EXA8_9BACI|nr:ATP-binding cassette domain-containing protein [Rossellomorea aquimaris]RBP07031.1 putative ABC transport system ATP-binding protein [Rossellomorea aquimaris]
MLFQIENVIYKNIVSIDHMEISANRTTCLIGESGAGKSTLLKLLNKMNLPDEGTIYYNETPLQEMDSVKLRREVVMISQTPLLFGETVEEDLQKGLIFSEKPPASREELMRTLEIVKLDKPLDGLAERLSGGERQRLSLGRVLLMKPPVYLLDEPTSALDEETEIEVMRSFIETAKGHGGTIIMVTHSTNVAEQYGEEIITISK